MGVRVRFGVCAATVIAASVDVGLWAKLLALDVVAGVVASVSPKVAPPDSPCFSLYGLALLLVLQAPLIISFALPLDPVALVDAPRPAQVDHLKRRRQRPRRNTGSRTSL